MLLMESSSTGSLLQCDVVNHLGSLIIMPGCQKTLRFGGHWAHLVGQKPKGHVVLV